METASQMQAIKHAYFTTWLQVYIVQKVITFKHGLNIGRDIYRVLLFHLQVQ